MRHIEPDQPGYLPDLGAGKEAERLRNENQDLKRQIQELRGEAHGSSHGGPPARLWKPSGLTIWVIFLAVTVLIVVAFFAGYIPLQKRKALIAGETHQQDIALPRVEVIEVGRSSSNSELELPGNIQAITEAP